MQRREEVCVGEHAPPRALVADDDPLARAMIKDALRRAGVVVVAEAQNGREAVELALHYRPDVVLMDVVMPVVDGIAATQRILKASPDQVIVILTSTDDDELGVLGLRAGAAGFLIKDLEIDALPRALHGALSGEAAISRRLAMRLVEELRHPVTVAELRPPDVPLTPREWDVVDLLVEGKTTSEIADTLVLSVETVRSHVKNICRKLGVRSRQQVIAAVQSLRAGSARPAA